MCSWGTLPHVCVVWARLDPAFFLGGFMRLLASVPQLKSGEHGGKKHGGGFAARSAGSASGAGSGGLCRDLAQRHLPFGTRVVGRQLRGRLWGVLGLQGTLLKA